MARDFHNEPISPRDAAAKNYRMDKAGRTSNRVGSAEVPVLFRLQNLQRNPDLVIANQGKTPPQTGSSYPKSATSSLKTSPAMHQEPQPTHAREATVQTSASITSPLKSEPVVVANINTSSASTASRPWSTNVILLGIGVVIVFMFVQRNPSNPASVASVPSGTPTPSPAVTVTAIKAETATPSVISGNEVATKSESMKDNAFMLIAPLAPPKLPAPMDLASELPTNTKPDPDHLSFGRDVIKNATAPSNTVVSTSTDIQSDDLSALTLEQSDEDATSFHKSVLIPDDSTGVKVSPSNASNMPAMDSFGSTLNDRSQNRQPIPTLINNPHVASSTFSQSPPSTDESKPSPMVATSTPDLETEDLFKLREQYLSATTESQQQAMARNRLLMTNIPNQAMMVSSPSQPRASYAPPQQQQQLPVYQSQPVQTAPAGYGGMMSTAPTPNPYMQKPDRSRPATVNQPYVPISSGFVPDYPVSPEYYSNQQQPQPPMSGGYQPLSPQFQSPPVNGN